MGCKKTTRIALRNVRNKLSRFQGFLRPLTLTLVGTDHQPGSKLEEIDILHRNCCSRTAIFSSKSISVSPRTRKLGTFDVYLKPILFWTKC